MSFSLCGKVESIKKADLSDGISTEACAEESKWAEEKFKKQLRLN
ncbi:hypothetical protein [Leeuwenhoekiella sp. H156]